MISRRALFGLTAGAAASAVALAPAQTQFAVGMDFGSKPAAVVHPLIVYGGKRHVDMTREELLKFVEDLDWVMVDLNKRLNSQPRFVEASGFGGCPG